MDLRLIPVILALLLLPVPAHARAPDPPDPDDAVRAWMRSLRRTWDNFPCCSEADCRIVDEFKMDGTSYVVKAKRKDFVMDRLDADAWDKRWPGHDEAWITVPRGNLSIQNSNPTGKAVLCYSVTMHQVFCYVPWDWKY